MTRDYDSQGQKLLSAVERLLEDPEDLISRVELMKRGAGLPPHPSPQERQVVATRLITRYSNRSAATGALSALPAILPGAGMIVAAVGGTLVDIAMMFKYEMEMALCLAHLHGFNISRLEERRLVFLLTSLNIGEIEGGDNFLKDVVAVEAEALWLYTPRQVTKLLITLLGKLAVRAMSRNLTRMLPLIGVVTCGTMNKVFTTEVGRKCNEVLAHRANGKRLTTHGEPDVVDARIQD
jgi:hypothetical protein